MTDCHAPAPAVDAHTTLRDSFFGAALSIGRHHVEDYPGLLEFVQDKVLFVVGRPARNVHGWIAPETWRNAGDYATEIYINAGTRGYADATELAAGIWTTIAHELAHAVNFINGVRGVSRQGRWHNRDFAEVALALGADIERHPFLGHVTAGPRPDSFQRYADEIRTIERALVLAWSPNPKLHWTKPGKKPTGKTKARARANRVSTIGGKYVSATCNCVIGRGQHRTIRVAFGSWSVGPILCSICNAEFASPTAVSDIRVSTGGEADARERSRRTQIG